METARVRAGEITCSETQMKAHFPSLLVSALCTTAALSQESLTGNHPGAIQLNNGLPAAARDSQALYDELDYRESGLHFP